jgi:segregation and condensation protein A
MAAWPVQLRARLLLPADPAAQQDAAAEADQLRDRLVGLEETQALAGWLERRPQLGHDVFVRGHRPSRAQSSEVFGVSADAAQAIDVIEFLWPAWRGSTTTPENRHNVGLPAAAAP